MQLALGMLLIIAACIFSFMAGRQYQHLKSTPVVELPPPPKKRFTLIKGGKHGLHS